VVVIFFTARSLKL